MEINNNLDISSFDSLFIQPTSWLSKSDENRNENKYKIHASLCISWVLDTSTLTNVRVYLLAYTVQCTSYNLYTLYKML